jgi:hypothetical protein
MLWRASASPPSKYAMTVLLGYSLGTGNHAWWIALGFLAGRYSGGVVASANTRHLTRTFANL